MRLRNPDNDLQKFVLETPYVLDVFSLIGLIMAIIIVRDILAKTKLSVRVIRYLGNSGNQNPLEAKEYKEADSLMHYDVTNKEGG